MREALSVDGWLDPYLPIVGRTTSYFSDASALLLQCRGVLSHSLGSFVDSVDLSVQRSM
jgi:hypothetical protein